MIDTRKLSNKKPKVLEIRNFYSKQAGFTVIELLIVFFLLSVLSIISIASFSSFNTAQKLNTTILDVKNTLQEAKSETTSQVDACQGQQFNGYEVNLCCSGSSCACPQLQNHDGYELAIVCAKTATRIQAKAFPTGITIDTNGNKTTTYTVLFNPLTNTVTGWGQITIGQGTVQKSISINSIGIIQ